jgi:hypothetical protein
MHKQKIFFLGGEGGGCGSSLGDVVAQLFKATGRYQSEDAAVLGSNPAPFTVS